MRSDEKIYRDLFLIWALRSFDTNGLVFPNINSFQDPSKVSWQLFKSTCHQDMP